jgi:glycosyltransferase involved in cell wall biosynthesis
MEQRRVDARDRYRSLAVHATRHQDNHRTSDRVDHRPTVSVIIPTYNRGHMVGRAIRSVLSQTFEDLELIIVDDGSRDKTDEVVDRFRDPRIRYIRHHTNRGAQAARNTGIDAARGDYVSFLDSDDEWLPEKLRRQVEVFRTNPHNLDNLGVVLTGGQHVQLETGARSRPVIYECYGDVYREVFLRQVQAQMPALVRKDVLQRAGHYDESLPAAQDWDMLVRLAELCQFDVVREPVYLHYHHRGDHVRTTENAIKAYRILFNKYAKTFARYPKYTSGLHAYLSSACLKENAPREARREAWCAMRLNPYQGRAYVYWLLSFAGGRFYRAVIALKKWLFEAYRQAAEGRRS